MKNRLRFIAIMLTLSLVACAQQGSGPSGNTIQVLDTQVQSRGQMIPVTYVLPAGQQTNQYPLVTMIHGHGGTRHEAGGFTRVAEGLAKNGIASIRMDFPGCGDSTESFSENNLTNMLSDIRASQAYALESGHILEARQGLLGFSMGGRLAMLLAGQEPDIGVIATWAPAGMNGADTMVEYLGGPDSYSRMRDQAKHEGYVPFTTFWGQYQKLGFKWFVDMEDSRPLDAIGTFTGSLFVLYGDLDDVVPPDISDTVINAATQAKEVVHHVVPGADHGLGLFNDDFASSENAVQSTVEFLSERL